MISIYSFFEIFFEFSLTRISLKELKKAKLLTVNPSNPISDTNPYEKSNLCETTSLSNNLKLWVIYALITLWTRHIDYVFQYVPGFILWGKLYYLCKCLFLIIISFPHINLYIFLFDKFLLNILIYVDNNIPLFLEILHEYVDNFTSWFHYQLVNVKCHLNEMSALNYREPIFIFSELLPFVILSVIFPVFNMGKDELNSNNNSVIDGDPNEKTSDITNDILNTNEDLILADFEEDTIFSFRMSNSENESIPDLGTEILSNLGDSYKNKEKEGLDLDHQLNASLNLDDLHIQTSKKLSRFSLLHPRSPYSPKRESYRKLSLEPNPASPHPHENITVRSSQDTPANKKKRIFKGSGIRKLFSS